jgi:hypothetical protein
MKVNRDERESDSFTFLGKTTKQNIKKIGSLTN